MKWNSVTPDDDILLEKLLKLLPIIFNWIKLEVLDEKEKKDVFDQMFWYINDLCEKEKGLTGTSDDGAKTTIDIETIFAMLEMFLKKNRP